MKIPVQTGISSAVDVEITEGLNEGDQILMDVTGGVSEGMAVMAVPQQ